MVEQVYPKYVLTQENELIFGRVCLHKDFNTNVRKVVSGGWWHLDKEKNTFYLYAMSSDFGYPKLVDIIIALRSNGDFRRLDRFDVRFSLCLKLEEAKEKNVLVKSVGKMMLEVREKADTNDNSYGGLEVVNMDGKVINLHDYFS